MASLLHRDTDSALEEGTGEVPMICQDVMQTAMLSSGITLAAAIALISFGAMLREIFSYRRR
jgi:hypothetical protein